MTPPAHDRVAVISDIHANLPALEAVLADIAEQAVDAVYCGGDLVGYGPHPNEVCALIEQLAIPTIYGNYDYAIGREEEDCGCAYVTPVDRALGERSVAWTLSHTTAASKAFMAALPFDARFRVGAAGVHLVHGSPRKHNEYLFEDKPVRLYERLAKAEADPVVVFGHTHKPWHDVRGGVLWVNSGSVGKPKDGDPRAGYVVLSAAPELVDVELRRVDYDAKAVARAVTDAGLPSEFADKLLAAA